jgi:hypothetical protein
LEDQFRSVDDLVGALFGNFGLFSSPGLSRREPGGADGQHEPSPRVNKTAPKAPHLFPKGSYPFQSTETGRTQRTPMPGQIDEV